MSDLKAARPMTPSEEQVFRSFALIPRKHEVISVKHSDILNLLATLDALRAPLCVKKKPKRQTVKVPNPLWPLIDEAKTR